MSKLRFLSILPAENPLRCSQGLNVMVMVDNPGEEIIAPVRFFGKAGGDWQEIYRKEWTFAGESHIHAYFHLPSGCFAPEQWGGEMLEELELWVGEAPPMPGAQGMLLFLKP